MINLKLEWERTGPTKKLVPLVHKAWKFAVLVSLNYQGKNFKKKMTYYTLVDNLRELKQNLSKLDN